MSLDPQVQALIDKAAIAEVLVSYCRAVDRADLDLLAACYHPDATEDHGGTFHGSASDYVAGIAAILPRSKMTHTTSNITIELAGDTALVESHILAFARLKKDGEKFDCLTLARAIDRFERRAGAWKIAERRMVWEWNHDMPMSEGWGRGLIAPDPSVLVKGAKKPADPLYAG
jgi:ketosteroid isomerase-like protein